MSVMRSVTAVAVGLAMVGCGGGDDDTGLPDAADGGVVDDVGDDTEQLDGGDAAFEVVDGPTVEVDPGVVVLEVDGERIEYPMAGSINLVCDVSPEYVQVNVQTPDGQSMSLLASTNSGSWTGSLNATRADDSSVAYGSTFGGGVVGIGASSVSYEGPIDKVVDRDIMNPETLTGTVAANCDSPGGDPTAVIGTDTYTFPVTGAQSFECTVGPTEFEIRVNRLSREGLQLEMQGRDEGGRWVGAVTVYTNEGNWTAILPEDGAGLTIDGGSVAFEGAFAGPDGSEVDGSATAACS